MSQAYFRELLETKPALAVEIIRFNLKAVPEADESTSIGLSSEILARHPAIALTLAQRRTKVRTQTNPPAGFWVFAGDAEKLALLPADVLLEAARMTVAAVYADDVAKLLRRDDVTAVKAVVGSERYRWMLMRGRFLAGSLAGELKAALPKEATLSETLEKAPERLLSGIRAGWDEGLRTMTGVAPQNETKPADDLSLEPLPAMLARRTSRFMKKLILREFDSKWTHFFD